MAAPSAEAPRSWSDIPPDLAGLVLGRLPAHVDRVRFAAVCPQWRSAARRAAAALPPPLPLLALKNAGAFHGMPRGEPGLPGCEARFLTACGSWLVYRRIRSLQLVDPFSGTTMTLPSQSRVRLPDDADDIDARDSYNFEVIKITVCSPDLIAALFWGNRSNRIAVCRPGASLWSVAWDLSLWLTDMAFYQGKLYVVDYEEDLLALDISVDDDTGDPRIAGIEQVIAGHLEPSFHNDFLFKRMLYLVESRGSLLMVRRMIFHRHVRCEGQIHTFAEQCEPELAVFEADFDQSQWVQVSTLGDDQALFLGPCSRAVYMPQCDSPGNRVWFLDDYKSYHTWDEWYCDSNSRTCDVAVSKPSSPLPMISWRGFCGRAGAAWLFPSN